MVVKNRPGGAGLEALNLLWDSEPDGLTLVQGITSSDLIPAQVFDVEGRKFDIGKLNYIGLINREAHLLAIGADLPYQSVEELQQVNELKLGAVAPTDTGGTGGALFFELFNIEDGGIVTGYGGTGEIVLGIARGEIDGFLWDQASILDNVNKEFLKTPLVTLDFERADLFPDTPTVTEIMELTPEQEALLKTFTLLFKGGKVVVTPPGVPEDRVQFIRDAFNEIVTIKAYLKQAKLRWPIWTEPVKGEDVAAEMAAVALVPKEQVDAILQLVEKYVR